MDPPRNLNIELLPASASSRTITESLETTASI